MLSRRAVSTGLLIPLVIALAGCATTTQGHGGTEDPAKATIGPPPTDAAGLAGVMQRSVGAITSAHINLDISIGAQRSRGQGSQAVSGGKLTALDLTESVGSMGTLRMLIVGEQTFVVLPQSLKHSKKKWTLITSDSSDPVIKSLDTSIRASREAVSLSTAASFVNTAKSLKLVGSGTVNGAPASHYTIAVDVSKLPEDYPGRDGLVAAGLKTLPVELWIDNHGRPVQMSQKFSVQGKVIASLITLGNFNAPLRITAPPSDQVSTS
jgi:hypothetical protein